MPASVKPPQLGPGLSGFASNWQKLDNNSLCSMGLFNIILLYLEYFFSDWYNKYVNVKQQSHSIIRSIRVCIYWRTYLRKFLYLSHWHNVESIWQRWQRGGDWRRLRTSNEVIRGHCLPLSPRWLDRDARDPRHVTAYPRESTWPLANRNQAQTSQSKPPGSKAWTGMSDSGTNWADRERNTVVRL